jgi:hypothetical protein
MALGFPRGHWYITLIEFGCVSKVNILKNISRVTIFINILIVELRIVAAT